MSDEEFLNETPYSLTLLIKRLEMREFKEARGPALIASLLANINRDSKKHPEPFSELEFIPAHLIPRALRQVKPTYGQLTPLQQRVALAHFFGCSVRNGKIVQRKLKRGKKK